MNFLEALKVLDLEEYEQRITHSNSHGELFHIHDYIHVAQQVEHDPELTKKVSEHIRSAVVYAKEHWQRPESIFQHLPEIFK